MYRTIITCDICSKEQEHGVTRYEVRIYEDGNGYLRYDVCPSCHATSIKPVFVAGGK